MSGGDLPSDFNASTFLYLNPEITHGAGAVDTVEEAIERYPTEFSNLLYRVPQDALEGPFLSALYLADNSQNELDVSSLNREIRSAIESETGEPVGDSPGEDRKGTFVPNLNLLVKLEDTEKDVVKLRFGGEQGGDDGEDKEWPKLTPCNILEGDQVMFLVDGGQTMFYAYVDSVLGDDRFRVRAVSIHPNASDSDGDVGDLDLLKQADREDNLRLLGIRVIDSQRLAHVNFARRFDQGFSNRVPTGEVESFNPDLYRILYPDAQTLTGEQAFFSLRQNWAANAPTDVSRIGRARDIMHAGHTDLDFTMNADLKLNGNMIWKGRELTSVSDDSVTNHDKLGSSNTIITEFAIKRYIARQQETRIDVNNFSVSRVWAGFPDQVGDINKAIEASNNNIYVDDAQFVVQNSDLEVNSNVVCTAAIAEECIASTRWGIGGGNINEPYHMEPGDDVLPPNGFFGNAHVRESLTVGNHTGENAEQWVCRTETLGDGVDNEVLRRLTFRRASAEESERPVMSLMPPVSGKQSDWVKIGGDLRAAGSILSLSDRRRKKNIETISNAFEFVKLLRGCRYDEIEPNQWGKDIDKYTNEKGQERTGERRIGMVAQEVQEVIPECVSVDPETGELGLAYGNLVGLLVEAVKDLGKRVDAQDAIISGLLRENRR